MKGIAEFFRTEYGRMLKFVAGMIEDGSDRDAEDVIQDVMASIFDSADVTRPINNLTAYVYGALRNRVIDLLRKRRPDVSLDAPLGGKDGMSLADVLSDARYHTVTEFEKNEIRSGIMGAISSLEEDERMLIIMTEYEGRSFREISEITEVPLGTLLSRKSRAMKKIKKELAHLFND